MASRLNVIFNELKHINLQYLNLHCNRIREQRLNSSVYFRLMNLCWQIHTITTKASSRVKRWTRAKCMNNGRWQKDQSKIQNLIMSTEWQHHKSIKRHILFNILYLLVEYETQIKKKERTIGSKKGLPASQVQRLSTVSKFPFMDFNLVPRWRSTKCLVFFLSYKKLGGNRVSSLILIRPICWSK